ncbi:hypothetical protein M3Y97_00384800 [Aphelenchoides bicaudatus]|nr:hypothetical protein M3Y97_00384800 [Aphelenchoides bicaudatus]
MKSIKSLFPFQKKSKCQDESLDDRRSFRQHSFRNPPINPYHVITEPKTKKATRSLPGGRMNTSSRQNNTMYENLANNEFQRRQRTYAQQMSRQRPIEEVDETQHRILIPSNYQHTSEYGSNDPSPTNPYSRNNNNSLDSSDSESEDPHAAYYRKYYERSLRKMERKKTKAQQMAKEIEAGYYKLFYEHEELKNQRTKLLRLMENYKVENGMLKSRVEELEKSQKAMIHSNEVYGGAPEAMCSISEINPSTIGSYPPRHLQAYNTHDNNEQDEVKIFGNKEEFELPRSASNLISAPCHLESEDLAPIKLELDEHIYLNGKTVEHANVKHTVHFQNNSQQEEESQFPTNFCNIAASVVDQNHTYNEQPIKRSFSDTDLRELRLAINESVQEEREAEHKNGRNRLRRGTTRYVKANNSSSYSSDDERIQDAIEIQTKQLKPRGEVVHFRPSRRSILNKGRNVYRRFGPNERKAVAEFDYLNDLSTNSSGLE